MKHALSLLAILWTLLYLAPAQSGRAQDDTRKPAAADYPPVPGQWPVEKAQAWYDKQPWLVGCNYIPATAINQIEMWQSASFDPKTIDKELGLAEGLGMNTLRVFLHDLVWGHDADGLYARMDQFLDICKRHHIRPLFVFFDDCHHPDPKLGPQPLPVPEYHNSGWVNCPARDLARRFAADKASSQEVNRLKGYIQGTLRHFKDDDRVLLWELYNEPGRGRGAGGELGSGAAKSAFGDASARLLHQAWVWAREVNPMQPIASCAEGSVGKLNTMIGQRNSDIISFHSYGQPDALERLIKSYAAKGRPALCTEYMARSHGSTFQGCLPVFKKHRVGCFNWGFVSGKTGTIWDWASRNGKDVDQLRRDGVVIKPGQPFPEPKLWFHDIYRIDGTPFSQEEVDFIRKMTGKS